MSTGRTEKPCDSFRPWRGQAPLCGNCAWVEEEHKKQDATATPAAPPIQQIERRDELRGVLAKLVAEWRERGVEYDGRDRDATRNKSYVIAAQQGGLAAAFRICATNLQGLLERAGSPLQGVHQIERRDELRGDVSTLVAMKQQRDDALSELADVRRFWKAALGSCDQLKTQLSELIDKDATANPIEREAVELRLAQLVADLPALRGAVARGWCSEKNSAKEMDCELAEAITQEVAAHIRAAAPKSEDAK